MTDYEQLVNKLRDLHRDPRPASVEWLFENQVALYDAAAAIEELQAQLPKRGEWIEDRTEIVCSKCHARFSDEIIFMNQNMENEALKYCPNCGAKMEVQDDKA